MYLSTGSTKAITPEDLLEKTVFNHYYNGGLIGYVSGNTPTTTIGDTQAIGKLGGCNYNGVGQGKYEFYAPVTINTTTTGSLTKLTSDGSTFKFLSTDPADWSISTYSTDFPMGNNASDTTPQQVQTTLTGKTNNMMMDIIEITGVTFNAGAYYGAIDITSSAPFIVIKKSNNVSLLETKGSAGTVFYYYYKNRLKTISFYGPIHSLQFFNKNGTLVLLN